MLAAFPNAFADWHDSVDRFIEQDEWVMERHRATGTRITIFRITCGEIAEV